MMTRRAELSRGIARDTVPRWGIAAEGRPVVRIESVTADEAQQAFLVRAGRHSYRFPYSEAYPSPDTADPVVEVFVDDELAREGFTYRLASGAAGSVMLDEVLVHCQDPAYLRNILLYRLTLEAQRQLEGTDLSRREIIRRLGTSPAQFYRLIDQTNYTKSIDKLLALLQVLGCGVELVVQPPDRRSSDRR